MYINRINDFMNQTIQIFGITFILFLFLGFCAGFFLDSSMNEEIAKVIFFISSVSSVCVLLFRQKRKIIKND